MENPDFLKQRPFAAQSGQRVTIPTLIFIIFWDVLIFYQIFFLPQVKPCVIVTYKHGIYELPYELSNDLRLRILGNSKILGKNLTFIEW